MGSFRGNYLTHLGLQNFCRVLGVTRLTDKVRPIA